MSNTMEKLKQSAYDCDGNIYRASTSTESDDPILVVKFNSPASTLSRYQRLCARYGKRVSLGMLEVLTNLLNHSSEGEIF